jgi:hypothetical protein
MLGPWCCDWRACDVLRQAAAPRPSVFVRTSVTKTDLVHHAVNERETASGFALGLMRLAKLDGILRSAQFRKRIGHCILRLNLAAPVATAFQRGDTAFFDRG